MLSGWKKIHKSPHANLDEAVSSPGAELKSSGAEENRQGSCCPEETPPPPPPSSTPLCSYLILHPSG